MTATYCCISAVHRVPVELWREILGFTLGPLLSNPEQDSLAEYKMLFRYYSSRPGLYVHKERIRASLMLVCKLWKDIVSDMDDKIMLVGGPDGYEPDWPPQKKETRSQIYPLSRWETRAVRIIPVPLERSTFSDCLSSWTKNIQDKFRETSRTGHSN